MTWPRNGSEDVKRSLTSLADRVSVSDDLVERFIENARSQRPVVVPLRRWTRTWLPMAAAAAVVAVIALAVSMTSGAPSSAPPGATLTPTQLPTTAAPTPTTPTSVASAACTLAELHVTSKQRSSQSGDSVSVLVMFENTSDLSCVLTGYPRVSAVAKTGSLVLAATPTLRDLWGGVDSTTRTAPSVVLDPADHASAVVSWSAAAYTATSVCRNADHLRLSLGSTEKFLDLAVSTYLKSQWRPCDLEVTPLVSGVTGSESGTTAETQPSTHRIVVRPVTSAGAAAPGYTIREEDLTDTCGEASVVAVDDGITSCGPTADYLPACWQSSGGTMLCYRNVWSREIVRVHLAGTLSSVVAETSPLPLGLELANGVHCGLRIGGAWSRPQSHPDWFGTYFCDNKQALWAPGDAQNPASSGQAYWVVHLGAASGVGNLTDVGVRTAYFVGTAG